MGSKMFINEEFEIEMIEEFCNERKFTLNKSLIEESDIIRVLVDIPWKIFEFEGKMKEFEL